MNEEFRQTAPTPLSPRSFNVPIPYETVLPNGLKVVLIERGNLPLVNFRLAFRSGHINDPADSLGLTSALASMLNEGTENRSSRQLAEEVENLGASLSASSSSDNIVVAASGLSIYRDEILDLMADMVLHPSFPENEIALYRQNAIEGLKVQRSNAGFLANERVSKILYGEHPYSVTSPDADDLEKISRDKLVNFHRKTFVPNHATMIVVGNFERDSLLADLENKFGNWQTGDLEITDYSALPVRSVRTLSIVNRPGSAQTNIVLANPAIKRNDPDYFPLLVMNQILGAGASSRLFMNLREEKGYTYGAYSSLDARRQAGVFEATAEVRTQVTGDSLKEFFYEINRIRDDFATAKELADAKNYLTGVFPLRAETQEGLTNLIVTQQLYDLPADYLQTYRNNIASITLEDVRRVAEQYLQPEKIAIVAVGDGTEILKQAEHYAENIDLFDVNGNPLDLEEFRRSADAPPTDISGKWDLQIEVQGQKLPVSLVIKQDGANLAGTLETMLGNGEITSGKISGNNFDAIANTEIQGQMIDLNLNGTVEDEKMRGTITASMPGLPPMEFEGKRAS